MELRIAQEAEAKARVTAAVQGKVTVSLASAIPVDLSQSPEAELKEIAGIGSASTTASAKASAFLPGFIQHELTQQDLDLLQSNKYVTAISPTDEMRHAWEYLPYGYPPTLECDNSDTAPWQLLPCRNFRCGKMAKAKPWGAHYRDRIITP